MFNQLLKKIESTPRTESQKRYTRLFNKLEQEVGIRGGSYILEVERKLGADFTTMDEDDLYTYLVNFITQSKTEQEAKATRHISVPYAQKDEAKSLGAKWDADAKSWYVPEGLNIEVFAKWIKS